MSAPAPLDLFATAGPAGGFVDVDVPGWAWAAVLAVFAAMLAVDLVMHRGDHEPSPRRALAESAVWVGIGVTFGAVVWAAFGAQAGGEYLAGYLVEKSLSVDNVFVWSVVFSAMAVPLRYQHRVLFYGIFGALVLRGLFIVVGTAALERFWWMLLVFGAFLVVTGVKVLRHRDDEGVDEDHAAVRLVRRFMPVTDEFDGHRFTTVVDGVRRATPLLAALVVVEVTDVIFALDSVPAVLAVSREPFIVFTSNAFAILGLRALYFLLAGARAKLHYLSHALGVVLVFVGAKMVAAHWVHVPTPVSLGVIAALLAAAVVASRWYAQRHPGPVPGAAPADGPLGEPADA